MENEIDSFVDKVKSMNGTLRTSIPARLAKFLGIKEGDTVKVWVRKK